MTAWMKGQWIFSPNHLNSHSQRPTHVLSHSVPAQVKQKYSFGFGMDFLLKINYRHIGCPGSLLSNKMRPCKNLTEGNGIISISGSIPFSQLNLTNTYNSAQRKLEILLHSHKRRNLKVWISHSYPEEIDRKVIVKQGRGQ